LDKERQTLVERCNCMNTQLNQRMGHADETQHKLNQAKGDTSKLKSMIHGLDLQINDYEKLNARLVEE